MIAPNMPLKANEQPVAHQAHHIDYGPSRPLSTDPATALLERRMRAGQGVSIDATGRVLWLDPNNDEQQTVTEVTENFCGQIEYFGVEDSYTGGFTKADLRIARSRLVAFRILAPQIVVDDEEFPGHEGADITTNGVISVNTPGHAPAARFTFHDSSGRVSSHYEFVGTTAPATADDLQILNPPDPSN
jgi:hypothetical protein